jgi:hypothetical protein
MTKFSGHLKLLEVVWILGVTGNFLVNRSYWKLSGHGELLEIVWSLELLEIVWSWKVTGNCLIIGVTGSCPVTPNNQTTSSNS